MILARLISNRCWPWLCIAMLLQACATGEDPRTREHARRAPVDLMDWRVEGKVAIRTPNSAETVNLNWQRQSRDQDRLQLSGALGLGGIEFFRSGDAISWLDAGALRPLDELPIDDEWREPVTALPLTQLGDWLLGHLPNVAMANGWRVEVIQWQVANGWRVPRKIRLIQGDTTVTLVLLDWQLELAS